MGGRLFLLGAGASADAGIPLTGPMGRLAVDRFTPLSGLNREEEKWALELLYASLIRDRINKRKGFSSDGVDIESLIGAAQLLAERTDFEPLVSAWDPAFEAIDRRPVGGIGRLVAQDPSHHSPFRYRDIDAALDLALQDFINPQPLGVFEDLVKSLEAMVPNLVSFGDGRASYLEPLVAGFFDDNVLAVATLNYDLTVETAADCLGKGYDDHLDRWNCGSDERDSRAELPLLKLHGSVSWQWERSVFSRAGDNNASPRVALQRIDVKRCDPKENQSPAIVFGGRNKLRAVGPFGAILNKFRQLAMTANEIVVVGYSFGDPHINAVLEDAVVKSGCRLLVCDALPEREALERSAFLSRVWRSIGPKSGYVEGESRMLDPGTARYVCGRAKDVLSGIVSGNDGTIETQ